MATTASSAEEHISCLDKGMEQRLLAWFRTARRDLPWRRTRDPYAIFISEIMLQQTQIETIKPYFSRFLQQFPTIFALSEANLQEILAIWAGLGYYRRARHLHAAAKQIVAEFGGEIPQKVEDLLRLPGVGRYTAGAVASIAFGQPVPVVDGNVMRVLARLTGYDRDIADAKSVAFFWSLAESLHESLRRSVPESPRAHGDLNEALMELGATVCVPPPGAPACLLCPVRNGCRAHAQGRQMELPVKSKKSATPLVRGVAVVIVRSKEAEASSEKGGSEKGGRRGLEVLLMQRPFAGLWSEMWEFPVMPLKKAPRSLKLIEPTVEAFVQGLLSVKPRGLEHGEEIRHQLTHRLHVYRVVRVTVAEGGGQPKLPACVGSKSHYQQYRWVSWPLVTPAVLPLAQIVHKVAGAAGV